MATPAGFDAAPPLTVTGGAIAVPFGCVAAGCACGAFGKEPEFCVEPGGGVDEVPGFSGSSTGGKGVCCDGFVCDASGVEDVEDDCCAISGEVATVTAIANQALAIFIRIFFMPIPIS